MAIISDISQLDLNGKYSYADYLNWHFDQAVEIINGRLFKMSPAPKVIHQSVSRNLTGIFWNYFKKKPCRFFEAPFDVRLYDRKKSKVAEKEIYTVVQPDLCVICEISKIDENGCLGSPDLIIEILSKGNSKKEMQIKYDLYEECGIKEYLIVDPDHEIIHQFVANETGKFQLIKMHTTDHILSPVLFPDLKIELAEVFEE
jgi:Uma2 family endonuclease